MANDEPMTPEKRLAAVAEAKRLVETFDGNVWDELSCVLEDANLWGLSDAAAAVCAAVDAVEKVLNRLEADEYTGEDPLEDGE